MSQKLKLICMGLITFFIATIYAQEVEDGKAESKPSGAFGAFDNPVKCDMPKGERQYLWRLRDEKTFEEPTSVSRDGSFGIGPYGNILDRYTVKFPNKTIKVFMDMYFSDYVENRPVPGCLVVSEISKQLIKKADKYYRIKDKKLCNGEVINKYEDGSISVKMNFKDGLLDGEYYSYHENGKLYQKKIYQAGEIADGEVISYYEDGQKMYIKSYKNGVLDGAYSSYYENGQLYEKKTYKADKVADGQITVYHENGKVFVKFSNKGGVRHGNYISYHKNGNIYEKSVYADGEIADGKLLVYHDNGQLQGDVTYKDGDQNGPYLMFFKNGKKSLVTNKLNGEFDGKYTSYHEKSGGIKEQFTLKDGSKVGLEKEFSESGNMCCKTVRSDQGELQDREIYYDVAGKKVKESYKTNPKTSTFTVIEYAKNGTMTSRREFMGSYSCGVHSLWNENGVKIKEITFGYDIEDSQSVLDMDGSVMYDFDGWNVIGEDDMGAKFVVRDGRTTTWDDNGKNPKIEYYKKGKLITDVKEINQYKIRETITTFFSLCEKGDIAAAKKLLAKTISATPEGYVEKKLKRFASLKRKFKPQNISQIKEIAEKAMAIYHQKGKDWDPIYLSCEAGEWKILLSVTQYKHPAYKWTTEELATFKQLKSYFEEQKKVLQQQK